MFIPFLRRTRPLAEVSLGVRIIATIALVALCGVIRLALGAVDHPDGFPPFLAFVPAILVATVLIDRWSGYLATVVSAVAGWYFFMERPGSFELRYAGQLWLVGTFLLIGVFTVKLLASLREALAALAGRTEALAETARELRQTRAELEKTSDYRAVLLADINHRIKNHLGSVAAGLAMTLRQVRDPAAVTALEDAIARLSVLGRVYTRLQLEGGGASVDVREFLETLCRDLSEALIGTRPIVIRTSIQRMRIDGKDAATLGLIANELITNALKYAFLDGQSGQIDVRLARVGGRCCLTVSDDGNGGSGAAGAGTGTKLIQALATQVGGTADWDRSAGTTVRVWFASDEAFVSG